MEHEKWYKFFSRVNCATYNFVTKKKMSTVAKLKNRKGSLAVADQNRDPFSFA
jgi:hypothetical protein